MRFISTVVLAAILLAIVFLLVVAIIDGYFGQDIVPDEAVPDAWAAPDSWSEWRDIVIVFGGIFWALAGLTLTILLAALVVLVLTIRSLLRENVAPAIDSGRNLFDEARGTVEFVGESAVSPIIRVYSIFSGVRRGMATVGSVGGRFRRKK